MLAMWELTKEMAPYLLFGYIIAGILHVCIKNESIYRHLSGRSFMSVLKATLLGVPMPLCSCGVIPVSAHLEKQGASKGAVVSFLVSTPTTGADSILATYGLLGPVIAVIRPVAAFIAGLLSGTLTNIFAGESVTETVTCPIEKERKTGCSYRGIVEILRYGLFELVEDTAKWLFIGITAGGVIGYFIPEVLIESYLGNPFIAYPAMILIAVPMYVCATGSIPIAAALIMKGMTPGAGLLFLIAGPATNTATLSFVAGKLGRKVLFIYLFSIVIVGLLTGLFADYFLKGNIFSMGHTGMTMLPSWLSVSSAILLILLIMRVFVMNAVNRMKNAAKLKKSEGTMIVFKVNDMTCQHCVKTLNNALSDIPGVQNVIISLESKTVSVQGGIAPELIEEAIREAGYTPEKTD